MIAGAALLGLAGAGHCAAMCAAPCAALCRSGRPGRADHTDAWVFHVARVFGYAGAGAIVAAGVSALVGMAAWSSGLQPLWLLLHLAALAFGLWLLVSGRQPAWLESLGRAGGPSSPAVVAMPRTHARPRSRTWAAGLAGIAWAAWPCGLLQAALLMAALADDAVGGAAVMTAFAVCTTPALIAGPWLWRLLNGHPSGAAGPSIAWALRGSGALLAAATIWALGHNAYLRAICSV